MPRRTIGLVAGRAKFTRDSTSVVLKYDQFLIVECCSMCVFTCLTSCSGEAVALEVVETAEVSLLHPIKHAFFCLVIYLFQRGVNALAINIVEDWRRRSVFLRLYRRIARWKHRGTRITIGCILPAFDGVRM